MFSPESLQNLWIVALLLFCAVESFVGLVALMNLMMSRGGYRKAIEERDKYIAHLQTTVEDMAKEVDAANKKSEIRNEK